MSPDLAIRRFSLPLSSPLASSRETITEREGFAVAMRTNRGRGVGEATPLNGWTEARETTERVLDQYRNRTGPPWGIDLPQAAPAARHALQLAVADLASRTAGKSLANYLRGTDASTEIPVNATVGDGSMDERLEAVRAARDEGYQTVKIKVGNRVIGETIEFIEAVAGISSEISLRVDANQAWAINDAQRVLDAAAGAGIGLIEEPLAEPTPDRLRRLDPHGIEIALDESLVGPALDRLDPWFEAADVAVLKPMVLGGIDRAIRLADRADAFGVEPIVSNTVEGVIARGAAVHLAAALRCQRAAGLATADRLTRDLAADIVPVSDGRIAVPDRPGIGTLGPWDRTATSSIDRC